LRTFAIGPVPGDPVNLSPLHPITHGGFQIHCDLDGDAISLARLEIGFVHRSAEKLFEVRDYRQGAMLANRHIWTSPTAGEYAYVLATEELLGILISPRADALRLIYCEIDRVLSHLAFLAPVLLVDGISQSREQLANFMAKVTGSRMHHQVIRIGGVAVGLEAETSETLELLLVDVEKELSSINSNELPGLGVGVVKPELIASYGITGPIARSLGIAHDERMFHYGAYRDFTPVVAQAGDVSARLEVLVKEIEQSITLIRGNLDDALATGELLVRTPKNLRVPEGESHQGVEGALGRNSVSLFSSGGLAPARLRLRSASFANLQALEAALIGLPVGLLPLFLAAWPALAGDSDR
jgi:NADH-quinone oxidoreductase subunit D